MNESSKIVGIRVTNVNPIIAKNLRTRSPIFLLHFRLNENTGITEFGNDFKTIKENLIRTQKTKIFSKSNGPNHNGGQFKL